MLKSVNGKYHIIVYGCQMSEHDGEIISGLLEAMGYDQTDDFQDADVIMLVTCCVRETAENKVWGMLGRLKKLKQQKRNLIIGVCGCIPQQKDKGDEIKQRFPQVDLIFGTHNIHELPRFISNIRKNKKRVLEIVSDTSELVEGLPKHREPGVKAWLTIMHGCNNFCTYCIVPYVRGRERSRKLEDIKTEILELVDEGYKDITLLGQNVNSYGKTLEQPIDFADLLIQLNKTKGLERLRYMSPHPRDYTDKLIDILPKCDKVCEHVHLPLQSGSSTILKKMNRGYSKEEYLSLVAKIKNKIPDVSITTDIIVGFPGETEEDFADTLDVVKRVRYDGAFTFVYNIREGTPAAKMPEQVQEQVKSERIQRLIKVQNKITLENNQALIGKKLEVLVEGLSKHNPNKLAGRTRTNKLVLFDRSVDDQRGKFLSVKITGANLSHLDGELSERR